ncbi:class I SAM-dependent methyltransferase [Candidatus Hydrogenedentota bacterium]
MGVSNREWYKESFGEDYLRIYSHRDEKSAFDEARFAIDALGIGKSDRVLDLCCGAGRHSMLFAKIGVRLIGLDLSAFLLEQGRLNGLESGVCTPLVRGNMLELPFKDSCFDAVVNFFTSLGYFSRDEDNLHVLSEIRRVLAHGGRFMADLINAEHLVKTLKPQTVRKKEGLVIAEKRWLANGRVSKHIKITEGEISCEYDESVRLYSPGEITAMLKSVGLCVERMYGDLEGSDFTKTSPRMVIIGSVAGS